MTDERLAHIRRNIGAITPGSWAVELLAEVERQQSEIAELKRRLDEAIERKGDRSCE